MKNGDILKCIDNSGSALTLGKKYIVLGNKEDKVFGISYVVIFSDEGKNESYFKNRFINLTEQRRKKLQKILTDNE